MRQNTLSELNDAYTKEQKKSKIPLQRPTMNMHYSYCWRRLYVAYYTVVTLLGLRYAL